MAVTMRYDAFHIPPPLMMNSVSGVTPFALLWAVHVLSVLLFFVGVLLLVVWMIKTFSHEKLKMQAIWFIVIGAVLCLLTIAVRGGPWVGGGHGRMMYGKNMMKVDRTMMGELNEKMMNFKTNDRNFADMREMMEEMMGDDDAGSSSGMMR